MTLHARIRHIESEEDYQQTAYELNKTKMRETNNIMLEFELGK